MKQPDLYYFEAIRMTSQAWSKFTENTRLLLVFSIQNLTRLVTSFLWFLNSIDRLFHRISVKYFVNISNFKVEERFCTFGQCFWDT